MTSVKRTITRADILPMEQFKPIRAEKRAEIVALKKNRRVSVGPYATFYFESFATMWMQVHEMLYIEKGGEEQIADELNAYNPLIPKGQDLVATVMFEIDDERRRDTALRLLTGIEKTIYLEIDGARVFARPETDLERTADDGKTSSVHFVHFDLKPGAIAAFKSGSGTAVLGFDHPQYGHMAVIPPAIRQALASDLS